MQQEKRMLKKHGTKCLCPDKVVDALQDLQKFAKDIVATSNYFNEPSKYD